MLDKNGMEIKTGMVVEIKDAFFKNDNGFYFVEHSAGDPDWCGSDHSLRKISKRGKISQAKHNLCFWPIGIFISDRFKAAEARTWNKEHATIEIRTEIDRSEVAAYFNQMAEDLGIIGTGRPAWSPGKEESWNGKKHLTPPSKRRWARMRRWKKRSCLVVRKASNTGTLNTVGISTYLQKRPESQNRNSLKL